MQSSHEFPLEWLENVSQYFPACFPAKAAVWGTINSSTRFVLAISSSDFQYLTAGWAIKRGVAGKSRIRLRWVELQATSAFPIRAKAEQLPRLFLAALFANMWYSAEQEVVSETGVLAFFPLESSLDGVRLSCARILSPPPIPGCPCRTLHGHVFWFIACRERSWALIRDGADQLGKMTSHWGFSPEILHFFSDYDPNPPISVLPTPVCVLSGVSGVWSGPKAKMLSGSKNPG